MTKKYLVLCFFLIFPLSGCFPVYIDHEIPKPFRNENLLERLKGQHRDNVVDRLGPPNLLLTDGKNEYMIYHASQGETEVIFLAHILLPVASELEGKLRCLMFTIDDANRALEYQIKIDIFWNKNDSKDFRCKNLFWDEQQLNKIETLPAAQ